MRTTALFAMILVGGATTATAQPKQEETSGRVSLNDSKAAEAANEPRAPSDWVELATPTLAKHGSTFIIVGKEAGGFGKLRIDAEKGAVPVKQIRVSFTDGKTKVFKVNKRIDTKRQKSLTFDLPTTKEIDQIVVVTDRRSKGEYTVHGSGTGGVIANR